MVDKKMATMKGSLPEEQVEKPWKNALITCAALVVPLYWHSLCSVHSRTMTHKFIGASLFSVVALALLGIAKAKVAGQSCLLPAAITLFYGAIAGATAYCIGWTPRNFAGL